VRARRGAVGDHLSETQWGTVLRDYSLAGEHGGAFLRPRQPPHVSLGGCWAVGSATTGSRHFSRALWNGADPILKEALRPCGHEGIPRRGREGALLVPRREHRATRMHVPLYKVSPPPVSVREAPEMAQQAGRTAPRPPSSHGSFFDGDRYFDVQLEYAKADVDDMLVRTRSENRRTRGPSSTLAEGWFRPHVELGSVRNSKPRMTAGRSGE